MSKNKLLILAIALMLLLANSGVVPAVAAVGTPPVPANTLSLTVSFAPLPIYPPLVLFTATMSRVPPSPSTTWVVDFFIEGGPSICNPYLGRAADTCGSDLTYIGSARVDQMGKAVLAKQLYPGMYTSLARVTINGVTSWSNKVDFQVR